MLTLSMLSRGCRKLRWVSLYPASSVPGSVLEPVTEGAAMPCLTRSCHQDRSMAVSWPNADVAGMQAVCWGPKAWQSWLHVLAMLLLVPCLNVFGGLAIAHAYLAATGQTTYEVAKGAKVCRILLAAIVPTAVHHEMLDWGCASHACA